MNAPRLTGIGFLAHTGWTAAVALAGPVDSPRVAARRRLDLWEGADAHAYHRAAEVDPGSARELIARAVELSHRKAADALQKLLAELGTGAGGAVIVGKIGRVPPDVAAVLRSHPLVHAAEGELFRGALQAACAAAGVRAQIVPPRELAARTAAAVRLPLADLSRRIAELGRSVGSPWGRDQKDCAAAAWLALAQGCA
jgi:hypothetical protein